MIWKILFGVVKGELIADEDIEEVVEQTSKFVAEPPLLDWKTVSVNDFVFEILMVVGIILYLVFYFKGKQENESIARKWILANTGFYEEQFAVVGHQGKKLIYDGPKDYLFFASGREGVGHVYGYISLAPRHDIISKVFEYFSGTASFDKVTLDLTLVDTDSVVFGIVPRSYKKDRWDLDQFTKPRDISGAKDYILLTENHEVTAPILGLESCRPALMSGIIDRVIFSDITSTKPEKLEQLYTSKVLRFVFKIPSNVNENTWAEVNKFVMDVVDTVSVHAKLSKQNKEKSLKLRDVAVGYILRQLEEERKKELADKKFKELKEQKEAILKLPPDQQRKAEEKLLKKEKKKELKSKIKRV